MESLESFAIYRLDFSKGDFFYFWAILGTRQIDPISFKFFIQTLNKIVNIIPKVERHQSTIMTFKTLKTFKTPLFGQHLNTMVEVLCTLIFF